MKSWEFINSLILKKNIYMSACCNLGWVGLDQHRKKKIFNLWSISTRKNRKKFNPTQPDNKTDPFRLNSLSHSNFRVIWTSLICIWKLRGNYNFLVLNVRWIHKATSKHYGSYHLSSWIFFNASRIHLIFKACCPGK